MSAASISTPKPKGTTEKVANSLALAIHEQRLAPGTKLGEDEIGDIYHVSRTVVRAALQSLAHIQLVDIQRNKGASVARPTPREAREVFEARALLEPRTARSAATRASKRDIEILQAHIKQEHAAMDAGNTNSALNLSGLFHLEVARIADQDTIGRFIETLIARSSLIIALYSRRENALCESHAHHALVQAIADGDEENAEDLMRSHLVDLDSALDLLDRPVQERPLRDLLQSIDP
jgi:DNA-binding GntR family transcriptional regulator